MKKISLFLLGTVIIASSCTKKGCTDPGALNYDEKAKKDDGTCTYFVLDVPTTYSFTDVSGNSTVNYSGQTERLNQMAELSTYMKTGNSAVVSAAVMKDMFANTGGNGNGNFSFTSTKNLQDKCLAADTTFFINLMDSLANASVSFAATASDGVAGTLVSGTSKYLVNENGVEYAQVIEKGLMGAVLMYQAANIYFGDDKMNVDNSAPATGQYYTEMEHHWDEAFGYFGVPVDFPTNTTGILYWGKYSNSRDAQLGCNAIMMNAFLRGRAAVSANELEIRDEEILKIRKMWEKICAAQAAAYFTEAKSFFGVDNAKFCHTLSEGYGFVHALKYVPLETRVISYSQIDDLLTNVIGTDFWAVTQADLTNAIDTINGIYGF